MIQIRRQVFETNSSMTHSCVIVPKREYDAWDDQVLFNMQENSFLAKDVAIERNAAMLKKWGHASDEEIENYKAGNVTLEELCENYWDLYDMWVTTDEYEYYCSESCYESWEKCKTIDGVDIVAFGYVGDDH